MPAISDTRVGREQRRLAVQYEVAQILAQSQGLRQATQAVFKTICSQEGFVAASLWKVSKDAEFLQYVDFWTEDNSALVNFVAESLTLRIAPNTGLAGRAWATGRPVWIPDIREVPDLPPPAVRAGLRSGMAFPVAVQGEVMAVMVFWSFNPREQARETLEMFHALGNQLGQYLERQIQSAKVSRLTRLHAAVSAANTAIAGATSRQQFFQDICRIAVDDGKFAIAWIGEYDATTLEVKPVAYAGEEAEMLMGAGAATADTNLPRGHSLVGRAIRTGQVVYTNDLSAEASTGGPRPVEALRRGYHSLLVTPLFEGDKVAGTLSLFAKEADFFTADEVGLLNELARHVSVVLEHLPRGAAPVSHALRDALTGAATRELLEELLRQAAAHASRDEHTVAIAAIKLANLNAICDRLGRRTCDALLQTVAMRIQKCIRKTDTLARVYDSEFALLLPLKSDAAMVSHVMSRLRSNVFDQDSLRALL